MLAVGDVAAAAAWWVEVLGFSLAFRHRRPEPDADDELNFAAVVRDDVEVHLARRAELTDRRRSEITITVADVAALGEELVGRGVPPRTAGRGIVVTDPSGNRIVFVGPAG